MARSFAEEGLSVGLLEAEAGRAALRRLFRSVAEEHGWDPGGDLEGGGCSVLVAACRDGKLAGGIELRMPDPLGELPMHRTWPELVGAGAGSPAELVLLALAPEFRGTSDLMWTLCAEMWRHCERSGVTDLLAAVPPRNLRIYTRLGWCPQVLGPEREHWGEPCLPCRIGVAAVGEAVAAKVRAAPSLSFVLERAHRE